jgi:hypothetical protein
MISNCVICGKFFTWNITRKDFERKTCSKECRYKSCKITWTKNKPKKNRICCRCGKIFYIPLAWLKKSGNRGIYCSRSCRWKPIYQCTPKEKNKSRNKLARMIKTGKIKRQICEVCGNLKSQAHHYLGYKLKNYYKVKWLCNLHHDLEEEKIRRNSMI